LRSREGIELLLAKVQEERYRNPQTMVSLARLAQGAADRLDPSCCGLEVTNDLRTRAWAELANAYRVTDDLDRAMEALQQAADWLERGTGDPLLLARVADLAASLCCDRRRLAEAHELLDEVHEFYREQGDLHLAGRALITKAYVANADGKPRQALALVTEGLKLIDIHRDPTLAASALQNLIFYTAECGLLKKARTLLFRARAADLLADDELIRVKLRWVEGRIQAGQGNLAAAAAFSETKEGFLKFDLLYKAGLAGLDLTLVWLRQRRWPEVRKLAAELVLIFQDLRIDREAYAAMQVLHDACFRELRESTADRLIEMAEAVKSFLEELPRRPGLRFRWRAE
jgi:tetratricopeptide (TPR) repeat protein